MLDPPLPELALLGRSNVGKSSLLNALVGRRIARISATPGKTRALNVFEVEFSKTLYLLDLPGYGYARVSKAERAAFLQLLVNTLRRPRLAGAVWLLDLRHEPSDGDRAMQDQLAEAGTAVLAAATKSDKLPPVRRHAQADTLRQALGIDEDAFIVTSARTGEGIADLREAIAERVA